LRRSAALLATLLARPEPDRAGLVQVQAMLRQAKARTQEALQQAITEALKTITADNAAAWFHHCGYGTHQL